MVIAVLLQESPLFSTCWYFKSNRILSHCLILFQLCPSTDHIQEYVGAVNISIPTGGENTPTKEPPTGKTQEQQESPHKQKSNPRTSRQGDQKDHNTESHRTPTIEFNPSRTANKTEHQEGKKQTKRDT